MEHKKVYCYKCGNSANGYCGLEYKHTYWGEKQYTKIYKHKNDDFNCKDFSIEPSIKDPYVEVVSCLKCKHYAILVYLD